MSKSLHIKFTVPIQGFPNAHIELDTQNAKDVTLWIWADGVTVIPLTKKQFLDWYKGDLKKMYWKLTGARPGRPKKK
jgi:hypothetical protein